LRFECVRLRARHFADLWTESRWHTSAESATSVRFLFQESHRICWAGKRSVLSFHSVERWDQAPTILRGRERVCRGWLERLSPMAGQTVLEILLNPTGKPLPHFGLNRRRPKRPIERPSWGLRGRRLNQAVRSAAGHSPEWVGCELKHGPQYSVSKLRRR
jgi:hypothetical protein